MSTVTEENRVHSIKKKSLSVDPSNILRHVKHQSVKAGDVTSRENSMSNCSSSLGAPFHVDENPPNHPSIVTAQLLPEI